MSRGIIELPLAEAIQNEMMLSYGDAFSLFFPPYFYFGALEHF